MRQSADSPFLDLKTLRAAVGGDVTGGQLLCPGPSHSRRDRSLAVRRAAVFSSIASLAMIGAIVATMYKRVLGFQSGSRAADHA
jgi:hypothetical protein